MIYNSLPDFLKMEHVFARHCFDIAENGIYLDQEKCKEYIEQLTKEIEEIDSVLITKVPPQKKTYPNLKNVYKKDMSFTIHAQNWIDSGNPYRIIDLEMERWIYTEPNLNSVDVLRDYLFSLGWVPSEDFDAWNYKQVKNPYGKLVKVKGPDNKPIRTTPKIPSDDLELEELSKISPDFKLVSDRIVRSQRKNIMMGYLKNVRADGRISMGINPCGAGTMRVTHSVVANIPRTSSYFGVQMRSLFRAAPGKILVGCDMSGLEMRILAHYLNDYLFTELCTQKGGKVHKHLLDEFLHEYVLDKDQGKGCTYAFLYGAGNEKLGSMAVKCEGNNKQIGKEMKEKYLQYVPNLECLLNTLKESYQKYQGVIGIDGRMIKVRSEHALLNTLCQSFGAIAAKVWTTRVIQEIKAKQIPAKLIIFYHDELVIETEEKYAKEVGEILVKSVEWAGTYLKSNVPLTGEYKIGMNWGEIH